MGGGEGQPQRFARHRALRHQSRDFLSSAAPARRLSMEPPMPETEPQAKIVLTTCATPDEAALLGRTLVEERLAACATLIPAVHSIYRWQGQVESATETLLLLKTGPAQIPALEARLHALHSYQTPEFLVLPVEAGSRAYLDWLLGCLGDPGNDHAV
jgi:periplasmic divalent cation tolerance protein